MFAWAAGVLSGCEVPATAIVIRVETDITRAADLGPLQSVDVRAAFVGGGLLYERGHDLGNPSVSVPGEVVLHAANADDPRAMLVRVIGHLTGGVSIERRFVVRFSPRRTTVLEAVSYTHLTLPTSDLV